LTIYLDFPDTVGAIKVKPYIDLPANGGCIFPKKMKESKNVQLLNRNIWRWKTCRENQNTIALFVPTCRM